jgi:hypothetical protein
MYDFLYREYAPTQGRWISPDPAGAGAVDPMNPQTFRVFSIYKPLSPFPRNTGSSRRTDAEPIDYSSRAGVRPFLTETATAVRVLAFFARVGKIGPLALGIEILEEENQPLLL